MRFRKEAWWNWDGSTNYDPHWRANAVVVDDFGNLLSLHRCADCRRWLLADVANFNARKRDVSGRVTSLFAWCRGCYNARRRAARKNDPEMFRQHSRDAYRRARADPERIGHRREQNRLAQTQYRRTEGYRKTKARYREKVRTTPALLERDRENQRISYRLRKERQGRALPEAQTFQSRSGREIPADPLFSRIERLRIARHIEIKPGHDDAVYLHFCESFGFDPRLFFEWRRGRKRWVRTETADYILSRTGWNWWDVWTKPENGHERGRPEDVLRYIGEANDYIAACLAFEGELVE